MAGETELGVATLQMTAGVDEGPVADARPCACRATPTPARPTSCSRRRPPRASARRSPPWPTAPSPGARRTGAATYADEDRRPTGRSTGAAGARDRRPGARAVAPRRRRDGARRPAHAHLAGRGPRRPLAGDGAATASSCRRAGLARDPRAAGGGRPAHDGRRVPARRRPAAGAGRLRDAPARPAAPGSSGPRGGLRCAPPPARAARAPRPRAAGAARARWARRARPRPGLRARRRHAQAAQLARRRARRVHQGAARMRRRRRARRAASRRLPAPLPRPRAGPRGGGRRGRAASSRSRRAQRVRQRRAARVRRRRPGRARALGARRRPRAGPAPTPTRTGSSLLRRELGDARAARLLDAGNSAPERCLRVNRLRGGVPAAVASAGRRRRHDPRASTGCPRRCSRGPAARAAPAFREGLVTPQSRGSQLAGLVAAGGRRRPGRCACRPLRRARRQDGAAGGAAAGAHVVAVEPTRRARPSCAANLARLGADAVEVVARRRARAAGSRGTAPSTLVLLDAPCSGLGTLASRPTCAGGGEPATCARLAALQARLLGAAAALVEPGGALTYSVCTLTRAETLEVVEPLLAGGGWAADDLGAAWPRPGAPGGRRLPADAAADATARRGSSSRACADGRPDGESGSPRAAQRPRHDAARGGGPVDGHRCTSSSRAVDPVGRLRPPRRGRRASSTPARASSTSTSWTATSCPTSPSARWSSRHRAARPRARRAARRAPHDREPRALRRRVRGGRRRHRSPCTRRPASTSTACSRRSARPALAAGVALNPATPLETLAEVRALLDLVLVMSVEPGLRRAELHPGSLDKLARARAYLPGDVALQVDGGVSGQRAALVAAGANLLVAGNSVFGGPDIEERFAAVAQAAAGERLSLRRTIKRCLQGGVKVPTGGESPRTPHGADQVRFLGRRSESGWEKKLRVWRRPPWSAWRRGFLYGRRAVPGRAFDAGRAGRGSTHPNPLVGAVLVGAASWSAGATTAGPARRTPRRSRSSRRRARRAARRSTSRSSRAATTGDAALHRRDHRGRRGARRGRARRPEPAGRRPRHRAAARGRHRGRARGRRAAGARPRAERAVPRSSGSGLPLVTYKAAVSLDGKVAAAGGDARWISCRRAGAWCTSCGPPPTP